MIDQAYAFSKKPVAYHLLKGWQDEPHAGLFRLFQEQCHFLSQSESRKAKPPSTEFLELCRKAVQQDITENNAARLWFEQHFQPYEIEKGFLTGYFEPLYQGSLTPDDRYRVPLLSLPQGWNETLPDRRAIEQGALEGHTKPVVYVKSRIEAFIIHIQGSARIALKDGKTLRLAYAGRNGHPYISIGKVLIERGEIAREDLDFKRLVQWLEDHPDQAEALMQENPSYIFFKQADLSDHKGPVGGAGFPLTEGRSLAIDRNLWPYGLPVWIEATVPAADGSLVLNRLTFAQDTGSAIQGAARADLFMGTGEAAGAQAGLIRHSARFVVFLPKGEGE